MASSSFKTTLNMVFIAAGLAAGVAQAAVMPTDLLVGSTTGKSGAQAELLMFQDLALDGDVLDTTVKSSSDFKLAPLVQAGDLWTIDVTGYNVGYFLLKFGGGNHNYDTHYIFRNEGDLNQLAFSASQVNNLTGVCTLEPSKNKNDPTPKEVCTDSKFSHYTFVGLTATTDEGGGPPDGEQPPTPGKVPEPASLALLGLGLAGLAFSRRRAA